MSTVLPPILRFLLNAKTTDRVDLRAAKAMYRDARESYYNSGKSDLTDAEYDALEDLLRVMAPKFSLLNKTGAKVGSKSEVRLNNPMPSLAKIKIENSKALSSHLLEIVKVGSGFYVSAKIDGSSVEVTYVKGRLKSLVTRGDGTLGKDISHFLPFLSREDWLPGSAGLPRFIKTTKAIVVLRMEATIPKVIHAKKYSAEYASDRAMASAVFNRHDASPALRDLHFVLLSVSTPLMSPQQVDLFVADHGFIRPMSAQNMNAPSSSSLEKVFQRFSRVSPYSLDGLVVGPWLYAEPLSSSVPKLTKSVKLDDHANAPETTIDSIVWNASSFGTLVPKAIISPVKFGNVTVKQAALHNVKWAQERGAGVGARVKVLRSGEIIPKIVEVLEPATFEFPDQKKVGAYQFDGVKITLLETNKDVQSKKIQRMFSTLGLERVGSGLADKLVDSGYSSTREVLFLNQEDVQSLPGVKSSARHIFSEISRARLGEFNLVQLMDASGVFESGLGTTLLTKLATEHPEYFSSAESLRRLAKRPSLVEKSIGPARCKIFLSGIEAFIDWVVGIKVLPFKVEPTTKGPLSGKNFSWTGYRSEEEENYVKAKGGSVVPFGSKTDILFFKSDGKKSSKIDKAGDRARVFNSWKESL